jgi:hypothetical protein
MHTRVIYHPERRGHVGPDLPVRPWLAVAFALSLMVLFA